MLLYRQRSLAKVLSFAVKALMDESKDNIGMCNSMTNMTNILRITCSKLTIETLEQGVKYVQC